MACIALVGHPVTTAPQNQDAIFFSYIALVNRKRRPTSIWATPNTTASFIFIEFKYLQGKWRQASLDRLNKSLIASARKGKILAIINRSSPKKDSLCFPRCTSSFCAPCQAGSRPKG